MHKYRTHKCNELGIQNVNENVKLSGWVHRKRDHGNLLFIDLRDHYGITQCVIDKSNEGLLFIAEKLKSETVISISGNVVLRDNETINEYLETGKIEVVIDFKSYKICVSALKKNWKTSKENNEKRITYRMLETRSLKLEL